MLSALPSFKMETLSAYLSWLAGFSGYVVATSFRWSWPGAYRWIAVAVFVVVLCLVLRSRTKPLALFGLLWMVFSLQPVLYFSNHSYSYYLAPALAGFSLLLASALDSLHNLPGWKRFLAIRRSNAAESAWIKVEAQVTVRQP